MVPWPVHGVFHLLGAAEAPAADAGAAQKYHYNANQRSPDNRHINAKVMRGRLIFFSYIAFLARV